MPEFFTGIGQLLNGSFLQSGALWTLTNVPGFPPIIQTVHILGIAVVMATIAFQSLRILGLAVPSQNQTGNADFLDRASHYDLLRLILCVW